MSFKNTLLPVANLLQSKGNLLDLTQPVVMGIINTTPDSFFGQSRANTITDLLIRAEEMIHAGVQIIDIGAVSTRPGAGPVTEQEERERLLPAISAVHHRFPGTWISVDTYRSSIARAAIECGAHIVNDISGGKFDKAMIKIVASLKVPYVVMQLNGNTPKTMHEQQNHHDITLKVIDDLQTLCSKCMAEGIKDLIVDPGFGFGKTLEEQYSLLNNLARLRILGKPLLIGISRKSMIYKTLGITAAAALNGTTALNMVALQQGAGILRVHDVQEAVEAVRLFRQLEK